jgi:anti-sigma factor RsiW
MTDHARHRDDVAPYLLGALNDLERQAFERHLRGCAECRDELERLQPAAAALPGSVEQVEPPPGLKRRLMAEVEGDSKVVALPPRRRRPARLIAVAAVALLALVVGFGVAQLGGDETRTLNATVAKVTPRAGGDLEVRGDSGTLRLHGMPDLGRARVYQVWLQHGGRLDPARTFEVGHSGATDVELPNLQDADGVFVTREARGGATVPSEDPIVRIQL